MDWTDEKPTRPGLYWLCRPSGEVYLVRVVRSLFDQDKMLYCEMINTQDYVIRDPCAPEPPPSCLWKGPIAAPEPPEKEVTDETE